MSLAATRFVIVIVAAHALEPELLHSERDQSVVFNYRGWYLDRFSQRPA
jgi:hypothetical protein